MSVLKWLGLGIGSEPGETDIEGGWTIVDALRTLAANRARYLASFAYTFSPVAQSPT